ncbi:MAG: valine--tRNA ligase [Methanomicrobiales archaeon]|jgi:valyl-tRNA synthetase|nr:valine--tRNA ligase [Methanomicrobiales archaeon]
MSYQDLPKNYDFKESETRWQYVWRDEDVYFNPDEPSKPQFIIDTPPPYPTGEFHIGNTFNWCYIDFIARYKRMRGYNVMFPQGWDCHGLPTEVKVEEIHGITKNDLPRNEFRNLCRELTLSNIEKMRQTMRRMGFSIDWSQEYITMMPNYFSKTQASFVKMYKNGQIYQSDHPVNFCPRCETAIALAEVSYEERTTKLNFFNFDGVEIATSRPELLCACVAVAVHPKDERYTSWKGKQLTVPIFEHQIPVIFDEAVDPAFGSGAVMICTFGDRQDVVWWKVHNLPLRKAIDKNGHMTALAGPYEGMTTSECQAAIISEMKMRGILRRQEPLEQRVGTCWRCKTAIEILSEHQWFAKIPKEASLAAAHEVSWYPEHMFLRMENWISQMEWDWCISRQRIFATPIPVWFCKGCHKPLVADLAWLPVDPMTEMPPAVCDCGSTEFVGESDVLDTWMDSSISALYVTHYNENGEKSYFPAQIRPQGHDIIRTWAFYTILRSVSLTGQKPWDQILINGMVLGEDGFKMSKSRGNVIVPETIIQEHGADSLRQWAALGAATGSDIVYNKNDITAAGRFQTKMWNIARFALMQIKKHPFDQNAPLMLADRWLLTKLSKTVDEVTAAMEAYQFDKGLRSIKEFCWDVLADNYIELVKGRLYREGPERDGACIAIHITLDTVCRLLAPYMPYFAEELYSHLHVYTTTETNTKNSVHFQKWPDFSYHNPDAQELGSQLSAIVAEVRRYKHDKGVALNAPLGDVTVYTPIAIEDGGDVENAINAPVTFTHGEVQLTEVAVSVSFNFSIIGPALRGKAKGFMKAISEQDINSVAEIKTVIVDDEEIPVPKDAFTVVSEYQVAGSAVDIIHANGWCVTIAQTEKDI